MANRGEVRVEDWKYMIGTTTIPACGVIEIKYSEVIERAVFSWRNCGTWLFRPRRKIFRKPRKGSMKWVRGRR